MSSGHLPALAAGRAWGVVNRVLDRINIEQVASVADTTNKAAAAVVPGAGSILDADVPAGSDSEKQAAGVGRDGRDSGPGCANEPTTPNIAEKMAEAVSLQRLKLQSFVDSILGDPDTPAALGNSRIDPAAGACPTNKTAGAFVSPPKQLPAKQGVTPILSQTPPVQTPPVQTPPVQTPPVQTPQQPGMSAGTSIQPPMNKAEAQANMLQNHPVNNGNTSAAAGVNNQINAAQATADGNSASYGLPSFSNRQSPIAMGGLTRRGGLALGDSAMKTACYPGCTTTKPVKTRTPVSGTTKARTKKAMLARDRIAIELFLEKHREARVKQASVANPHLARACQLLGETEAWKLYKAAAPQWEGWQDWLGRILDWLRSWWGGDVRSQQAATDQAATQTAPNMTAAAKLPQAKPPMAATPDIPTPAKHGPTPLGPSPSAGPKPATGPMPITDDPFGANEPPTAGPKPATGPMPGGMPDYDSPAERARAFGGGIPKPPVLQNTPPANAVLGNPNPAIKKIAAVKQAVGPEAFLGMPPFAPKLPVKQPQPRNGLADKLLQKMPRVAMGGEPSPIFNKMKAEQHVQRLTRPQLPPDLLRVLQAHAGGNLPALIRPAGVKPIDAMPQLPRSMTPAQTAPSTTGSPTPNRVGTLPKP